MHLICSRSLYGLLVTHWLTVRRVLLDWLPVLNWLLLRMHAINSTNWILKLTLWCLGARACYTPRRLDCPDQQVKLTDWLFSGWRLTRYLLCCCGPAAEQPSPDWLYTSSIHVAVAGPGKVVVVHRWRWWLLLTRRRCRQVRFVFSFQPRLIHHRISTPAQQQRFLCEIASGGTPYTHIILYPLNGFSQRTTAAGDEPARSHIQGGWEYNI